MSTAMKNIDALKKLREKLKFWQISYQGFDVEITTYKKHGQQLIHWKI